MVYIEVENGDVLQLARILKTLYINIFVEILNPQNSRL